MNLIKCPNCASLEISIDSEIGTCEYCDSRFAIPKEQPEKAPTTIGIEGDVARLLKKCEDDPSKRRVYANLILDIDPHNLEARKYLKD
jgi:hypothetical protein